MLDNESRLLKETFAADKRKLELHYEMLYEEVNDEREKAINGELKAGKVQDYIRDFDMRAKGFSQNGTHKVNVSDTVDGAKKSDKSVKNFWVRAMLNHPQIRSRISKKDQGILRCLNDI